MPSSRNCSLADQHIDQLQAGLFHLMTQYTFSHSAVVAAEIVDHVQRLLDHPHIELLPAQRGVLAGLLNKWQLHRVDPERYRPHH